MIVTFDRSRHEYRVDGVLVPYVSAILDAALGNEALERAKQFNGPAVDHARARGEYVDACCDLFDAGELDLDAVHEEARPYVEGWLRFRDAERWAPIHAQGVVYHAELGYAGCFDGYGLDGRKVPTVLERKCTAKVAPTYALQLAGYAMPGIGLAVDGSEGELLPLVVARRVVVQLRPDGSYRLVECDRPGDFDIFRAAVAIAKWKLNGLTRG